MVFNHMQHLGGLVFLVSNIVKLLKWCSVNTLAVQFINNSNFLVVDRKEWFSMSYTMLPLILHYARLCYHPVLHLVVSQKLNLTRKFF